MKPAPPHPSLQDQKGQLPRNSVKLEVGMEGGFWGGDPSFSELGEWCKGWEGSGSKWVETSPITEE